jgi:general secretion pathway protein K
MLAMMAAALTALSVNSARLEHRARDGVRLDADIEAGVARAALGLGDSRRAERWPADGTAQHFVFHGDVLSVAVEDERGKLDLNAADAGRIAQLLQAAGLQSAASEALSAAIVDWRTPQDADQPRATHDGPYRGRSYAPRHAPFQSVDELNLVSGMDPGLFARIAPALTVYSHSAEIDAAVSPPSARALLADPGGQPQTKRAVPDSGALAGHSFAIHVIARHGQARLKRDLVILFTDDKYHPYWVEAWR